MRVKINGKLEEVEETTIWDLLKVKNIEVQMVTVEVNSKMLDRASLDKTFLHEGDEIEFLYFMGGGRSPAHI